jgi:[acyl-carrier-protein] S-malonyltransferase
MGRTALLFAGQGAQAVGMGRDLAEAYGPAREVFETADRALGFSLSKIMFEGPKDELDSTENAQPAVLAMGVACLRALEAEGKLPEFCCAGGLSLGEYGAHVAVGSIGAEDATRLVRRRGELMRDAAGARPGGMASVLGLEPEKVEEACREASSGPGAPGLVAIANRNSPGQIVISGETAALERASELCREKGAKRVIKLDVSGAFHTPLMQPAREGLEKELAKVEVRHARVPVIANATADYVAEPGDIRRTLLDQLTGTVLFEDSVRRLAADGVTSIIELGPGKVLSGLVRRTARDVGKEIACTPVGTVEAVKAL